MKEYLEVAPELGSVSTSNYISESSVSVLVLILVLLMTMFIKSP